MDVKYETTRKPEEGSGVLIAQCRCHTHLVTGQPTAGTEMHPAAQGALGLVATMAVALAAGRCEKWAFLEVKGLRSTN